ncbi:hypothetical protein [Empedobacter sp.]|uniref:hypothetical protein n=1 Tax=Empedobacter sp. TaxID=1927715 RepID=UPI0028AC5EF4|nr:hypothetical protein [Empedobacter sp.]
MKKIYLFNWIFLLIGLISSSVFGQIYENIIPARNGVPGYSTWQDTNVAGTTYLQLLTATSSTVTPSLDLTSYESVKIEFEARTYGGSSTVENTIYIAISNDNGISWTDLGTRIPTSSNLTKMPELSTVNNSNQAKIKFYVKGTDNKIGVGINNITISGAKPITIPPVVTPRTITGTYGVLLTDGVITAINNPLAWTDTGGSPLGITLNPNTGIYTGTPMQAGTFTRQVTAINQFGPSAPATIIFEIAKANQSVNYTFNNISQNQGTTFSGLPSQTDQGQNIVYTSADNSIVSTNANTLSFDGIGSTTITATAIGGDNFNDYTTTFNVTSKDPNVVTYNGQGTFVKVNSLAEVTDGYYVITNETNLFLMTNNLTSGILQSTDADVVNGEIINPSTAHVWKIETDGASKTIYNEIIDRYVGWTSGNTVSLSDALSNNFRWTFKYENAKFIVNNVSTPVRQLSYNASSPRFAAYGNANQEELQLYKLIPSASTTWDGTAWSNGTPDLTKEVILHATPTESFSAKKLTIERDMIIPAGITITVENEVVNQNDVTFRFSHGAYLIQKNNSAVNVGPAMFDRSSTPIYRLENMTWSSPVIGQNIFEISPKTLTNRFTRFNESTNDWDANVTSTDTFQAGELIAFRAPNDYNNYGEGEAQVFESSFRGQLFNGEVKIPVTKTSKGNNAVGNPYASPLSLDALIAANTSVGVNSVYVWTHSKPIVNGAYQGSNWAIYNGIGWNDPAMTSPNIDIAQGFIVKVANAGNLVLNNAMRTSANGPVYYKGQKDRYWLSLSADQIKLNTSLIGYGMGSTNKFDQNFDAQPFDNNNEGLYSVLNNDLFVIQGRGDFNNEDSFDLTFNVKKAGTYQINLEKFEGVFENQNIYLVDKKLDKVFNLNELKSYSFDTEVGEINDRFSINYQNKTLSTNDLSKKGLVVYAQNKQITISSKESIKSIKLVDISGRQLQNIQNINIKNYVINLNVNPQVVVVVVENTNGTTESRKVILK